MKIIKLKIGDCGFTMVEMVVIFSMVTAISGIVLINFTGFNESTAINRSARELALSIRRAQNMALAVRELPLGNPAILQVPSSVGVNLKRNQNAYTIFGDIPNPNPDNFYTNETERIGSDAELQRNVTVKTLTSYSGGFVASRPEINILFLVPDASVYLTDQNGISAGDRLEIELTTPAGQNKTITVRTSGQISIK